MKWYKILLVYLLLLGCGTPLVYYMGIEENRKMAKDFVKHMISKKCRTKENAASVNKDEPDQKQVLKTSHDSIRTATSPSDQPQANQTSHKFNKAVHHKTYMSDCWQTSHNTLDKKFFIVKCAPWAVFYIFLYIIWKQYNNISFDSGEFFVKCDKSTRPPTIPSDQPQVHQTC